MVLLAMEQMLILVAVISGIPLLISTTLSLVVSFVQAATQIQEQSIGFLVKVSVIGAVFTVGGPRIFQELVGYFRSSLESIRYIGGQ